MNEIKKKASSDIEEKIDESDPLRWYKYKKPPKKFADWLFGTREERREAWYRTKNIHSGAFSKEGFKSLIFFFGLLIAWLSLVFSVYVTIHALGYNPPSFIEDGEGLEGDDVLTFIAPTLFLVSIFNTYYYYRGIFYNKIYLLNSEKEKTKIIAKAKLDFIRSWETFFGSVVIGAIFIFLDVASKFYIYNASVDIFGKTIFMGIYGLVFIAIFVLMFFLDRYLTWRIKDFLLRDFIESLKSSP